MSNMLSENWQFATMIIEDDCERIVGTGFLVADTAFARLEYGGSKPLWEKPLERAYLVTARHVLGGNRSEIAETIHYVLHYNTRDAKGFLARGRHTFVIDNENLNWALHPDSSIDVAVLDVTTWLNSATDLFAKFCPFSEVANPISLLDTDCEAGDDVFVLGYPLCLRQGNTNLPIVRKGVLASSPRRPLRSDTDEPLRGFLIDGAIMPGSSGSPVIATSTRFIPGDLSIASYRPLLLGVVTSEWTRGPVAKYEAVHLSGSSLPVKGYANLGFAHSASTVIETIEVLGHHNRQDLLKFDHDNNWASQLKVPEWAIELDGHEVDSVSVQRILLRLKRDRMRALGFEVRPESFHDAIDLMGQPAPTETTREEDIHSRLRRKLQ